jgi:hypothetical protein
MNVDGSAQTRLTTVAPGDGDPNWSPDAAQIAFATLRDGNYEIYTMNANGTGQLNRSANGATDLYPAWSPNGAKITFSTNRDGNDEIYTMNADGGVQTRLTTNAATDMDPDWQPLSYQHPISTDPIEVPLVPVFRQTTSDSVCTARGGTPNDHAAPFAFDACDPPVPVEGTTAYLGSDGIGSATLTPIAGDPTTSADEADWAVSVTITDVRTGNLEGADYGPDLTLAARFRMTDKRSCAPPGCSAPYYRPATIVDLDLTPVPMDCAATPNPAIGATCIGNTTADAIAAGAISESRQTVLDTFRVRVNDAGPDGIPHTNDDKLFAMQGIYIP